MCGTKNCRCKDKENPQKHGPYYSLSYSIRGRSTSRFIRAEQVADIKKQLANHQRWKELVNEWKNTAAEYAKLKLDLEKEIKK